MARGIYRGPVGGICDRLRLTITVDPLVHILVILLQPFLASLDRAAKLAVLERDGHLLAGAIGVVRSRREGYSGANEAYFWRKRTDCGTGYVSRHPLGRVFRRSWEGKR